VSGETKRLGQVPGLDGLRGIAVLVVVLFHTAALANVFTSKITTVGAFSWVNDAAAGGFLGVDIFFVLSGFLITALLL
jgi:peptidoglycan/LPS O-acetylase OafA/YrhL